MIRCGKWQDVLADVRQVDAVICDPPYGAKVHCATIYAGKGSDQANRRALDYDCMTPADVHNFVSSWAPRCRGWFVALTSDDLIPVWQAAYRAAGRYAFAAVPVLQHRVRLAGDGPASSACYLMASRPRSSEFSRWGSLPGWYLGDTERSERIGGKPIALMRSIVCDYSRPADLVADPYAGHGSTLAAAILSGRRAIGAEVDPAAAAKAQDRLQSMDRQLQMFTV